MKNVTSKMDEVQLECFRLYAAMGRDRTLGKVFEITQEREMKVTFRMLKRWQQQFKWTKLAEESAAAVAEQVAWDMHPVIVDHAKRSLEALHKVQDRFFQRLALDPNDPNLTPQERLRAFDPDFKEFAESVKLERLIMGDPTERHEDVKTSRVVVEFTQSELFKAAQQIAEKRYGLPPPKPVTIDADE